MFKINVKEYSEGETIYKAPDLIDIRLYYLNEGGVSFSYRNKYEIDTITSGSFGLL